MPDPEYIITGRSGEQMLAMMDDLVPVYLAAYSGPPYFNQGVNTEEGFRERTANQALRPGAALIIATTGDQQEGAALAGFAFGFTMESGAWWRDASEPDAHIKRRAKFALIELVVLEQHRGHGLGRRLHNAILTDRAEPLATLCATPDAQPARAMYDRWGWEKVGTVGLAGDLADILVLDLLKRA